MVKEPLVNFSIKAGRALLEQMDGAHLDVTAAYWWFVEEDEEWRLFLATPLASSKGPLFVIRQIQQILSQMPQSELEDLSIQDIAVVPPQSDEIDMLRAMYGKNFDGHDRTFRRVTLDRHDPFVYRLK